MSKLHQRVNAFWYEESSLATLLTPLSGLFGLAVSLRKRKQSAKQHQFTVPVVVVGNITVGGTGKTPMVVALVTALGQAGYRVGVASRGYGGQVIEPTLLDEQHSAREVGDEPVLIYQKTQVRVVVGGDRIAVIESLINEHRCDLVICDDGLQDYRFHHTLEIVMVDGKRIFGNQHLLPAGPLREPLERLHYADFVVASTNSIPAISSDCMKLNIQNAIDINDHSRVQALSEWRGKTVHAVAGIGHPQRFFDALRTDNIQVIEHEFPDHAMLKREDLTFPDQLSVLMTEKDAVKYRELNLPNTWMVPLETVLPDDFITRVVTRLRT